MANIVQIILTGKDQSSAALQSATKGMSSLQFAAKQTESAFAGLWSTIAGFVSVGAIVALGRSALQLGDELANATEKFGVGAEKLSVMRYAAQLTDVDFQGLGKALQFMAKNASLAATGSAIGGDAFKAMGISVRDSSGHLKTSADLFDEVAKVMAGYKDSTEKTALVLKVFGREGADIIPMLNEWGKSSAKLTDEATKLGLVFSGEQVKKLEEYEQVIKKAEMAVKAWAASVVLAVNDANNAYNAAGGNMFSRKWNQTQTGKISDILVVNPDPNKTTAPLVGEDEKRLAALKKAAEEAKKIREKYQELDLKGQVAFAEAMVQASDAEAKALADIDKKMWEEKDKENEKYQQVDLNGWTAYAEAVVQENDDMATKLADASKEYWAEQERANKAIKDFVINGFNNLSDSVANFVTTGKLNIRDFVNSAIGDLARLLVKMSMFKLLEGVGLGSWMGLSGAPGRASGGPVSAGGMYLVGERGPELFAPGVSGSIIPNGGGGGNVTVNIRNEGGQQVQAKSARASFDGQGMIVDVVIDAINRNVHGLRSVLGGA